MVKRTARRGQLIPVLLIALVLMAILGIAVLFSGSSDYQQSALVVYGLRAQQLALAAQEEAQAALYDALNSPVQPPPELRTKLLNGIRQKVVAKDAGTLVEMDLLKEGKVVRSAAIAESSGGKLESAVVRFYGFRRVKYQIVKGTQDDLFASEIVFYHDPTRTFDKSGLQTPEDFVGLYTLKVRASYGKIAREVSVTHDMKIVDVSPPAKQFALFSFYSANSEAPNGPPPEYTNKDLNQGGGFKVFANGEGRIFVRGPFLIEPEDVPTGAGGRTPPTCTTFPPEEGRREREAWHGWAAVPAIRDGIVDRAGWSAFSLAVGPKRPDLQKGSRFIGNRVVTAVTGSLLNAIPIFNDDAGWYILKADTQPQWYAGTRAVDTARNSAFSLVGDPADTAGDGFRPFVGLLWKYSDKREPAGDSRKHLGPGKRSWVAPPDADKETFWSIEPEGGLVGAYNRIKFEQRWSGFGWDMLNDEYECTTIDTVRANYGYRWEKAYERGWFNKVFGDVFKVGVLFLLGPVGGLLGLSAMDSLGITPFSAYTPPLSLASVRPSDVVSVYPPNYKLYERIATRHYPDMKRLLPPRANPDEKKTPVVLDGVVWVDDPSTETGFTYKGRGILYSDGRTSPTSAAARGARMALPVIPSMPAGTAPTTVDDYLTLVWTRDETAKAHLGDYQLEFSLAPEAGDRSMSVFQGSVVSLQGVRSKEKTATIAGNLVCGFINKGKIPDDARVEVKYNTKLLPGVDPDANAKFQDGSWHVLAVSPRASGYHER